MNVMWNWLVTRWNWPGAAAFCGIFLLVIAPIVGMASGPAVFWIFLQLPVYMLHQLEEHAGDRFRIFANQTLGKGTEVLTRKATFLINSAGVWGINLVAIYLAALVNPGWGLVAMYLPLVNSLMHIGQAVAMHRYNPGLVTAILLFIPCAAAGIYVVGEQTTVTWTMQMAGLGVAVLVHGLIILHVRRALRNHAKNHPLR